MEQTSTKEEQGITKETFHENHRYAVAWRDENGKIRPLNIYVYKLFDDTMIIRRTDKEGLLYKIKYTDITKIVKTQEVPKNRHFMLPKAMLDAKTWNNRTSMYTYSSAPSLGK